MQYTMYIIIQVSLNFKPSTRIIKAIRRIPEDNNQDLICIKYFASPIELIFIFISMSVCVALLVFEEKLLNVSNNEFLRIIFTIRPSTCCSSHEKQIILYLRHFSRSLYNLLCSRHPVFTRIFEKQFLYNFSVTTKMTSYGFANISCIVFEWYFCIFFFKR